MTGYRACTIVARNYLAQAEVLARSFIEHHPHIEFVTLVIDGTEADRERPGVGRVVLPSELGLDPALIHTMSVIYDVMEYATALKPALLMALLREGSGAVAYVDPDVRFYEAIDDVFDDATRNGIFLTPHVVQPIPRDGKLHTEAVFMQAGMFNLGFIAVGPTAYRFLSWWHERLQTDAIVDTANALFTDQRWVDWVPTLFSNHVSRDPGLNTAYWNLHERELTRRGQVFYAGDHRLRFFHFSGYDPQTPWIVSKHLGDRPRTLLSENDDLRVLFDNYKKELDEAGHSRLRMNPYLLSHLPNGVALTVVLRRIYRHIVIGTFATRTPPPDPIDQSEQFFDWLVDQASIGERSLFSPLDLGLWHVREDLRGAFPDVHATSARAYRAWLDEDQGVAELRQAIGRPYLDSTTLRASPRRRGAVHERHPFGWSAVAYATSELGVGEAGRRVASSVRRAGLPTELVGVTLGSLSRQQHRPTSMVKHTIGYENAIVCVNADQLPHVADMVQLDQLRGEKIGYWFWELEQFPLTFHKAFDLVHEVWTASEFTKTAIEKATNKTVRVVKLPMDIPLGPTRYTRRALGMPNDCFIFLTNLDYLSVIDRKNPVGAIRAYCSAFSPDDGAVLIVKSINGHLRPLDMERVRMEAAGRSDVVFIENYVTSTEMKAMIELADCYVSLHRAEGFGLNLADAMSRHTPTIATAYSGNMEFMSDATSELIPYSMIEVGKHASPYDAAAIWAQPDEDAAAAAMRRMFDDRDGGRMLADRAFEYVVESFAIETVASELQPLLLPLTMNASGDVE